MYTVTYASNPGQTFTFRKWSETHLAIMQILGGHLSRNKWRNTDKPGQLTCEYWHNCERRLTGTPPAATVVMS